MLWDVFISHASEDKDAVARPLRDLLEKQGLRVWLDETQLKLGDSLREKIDEGLLQSAYGIVILSPAFFAKQWPQRELNGLVALEPAAQKTILPIWHEVGQSDVARYSPLLADRKAVSSSAGLEEVGRQIFEVAGKHLQRTSAALEGRYAPDFAFPLARIARAIEVIESLGQEVTWNHLTIKQDGWMGTDNSTLVDILYDLMAPLVEFHEIEYGLRRSLSVFSPRSRLQFSLLDAALSALYSDTEIAVMSPAIEYSPRAPGWRAKRQVKPQRYWWQGLSPERFGDAVPFFLKRGPSVHNGLIDVQAFRDIYHRVYKGSDSKNQQAIGLLANALYGFSPAVRPVYWRMLIIFARLYRALLGNSGCNPDDASPDQLQVVFQPADESVFPFAFERQRAGLFEPFDVTLKATLQYLELFALPKLRANLSAPRET